MSRRAALGFAEQYPFIEPCYYCGLPATTVDHVIPVSMLADLSTLGDDEAFEALTSRFRKHLVPACRECNSILGNKYVDSLAKRREYVKKRLRTRYDRFLETPDWNDSELSQVSDMLQGYIVHSIAKRDLIRQRIAWSQGSPDDFEDTHRSRLSVARERLRYRSG
jgi:hypothetical protein